MQSPSELNKNPRYALDHISLMGSAQPKASTTDARQYSMPWHLSACHQSELPLITKMGLLSYFGTYLRLLWKAAFQPKNPMTSLRINAFLFVVMLTVCHFASASNHIVWEADTLLHPTQAYQPRIEFDKTTTLIQWKIEKGYFLYRKGFKVEVIQDGKKTNLPFTVSAGEKKYDEFFEAEVEVEVYHHFVTVYTNTLAYQGRPFRLELTAQGCADHGICFPPTTSYFLIDKNLSSTLQKPNLQPPTVAITAPTSNTFQTVLLGILGAFLGGLILNAMPCVFPVISLKALSFSIHTDSKTQRQHGWAYTGGIISTFLIAAGIIFTARFVGQTLGWGFQLQNPSFVMAMIYLFFVMGLSLSGFIELGSSWMGIGQNLTSGHSLRASFLTGTLAVLVASPCTAPFMGTALSIAFTQPPPIAFIIFIMLGLGMACPFLLLSHAPSLSKYLPKPGAWMQTLKQALAFPLYLSALWLLWVLSHQKGSHAVIITLLGMLMLVFTVWMVHLPFRRAGIKALLKIICTIAWIPMVFALINATTDNPSPQDKSWAETYTMQRLSQYLEQGQAVLVDLTADWCLTCKVNEKIAFTAKVQKTLQEKDIAFLIGDWTNKNPEIEKLLSLYRRNGIPLYLMFPANGKEAKILPQILTEKILLNAIDAAL